MYTVRLYGGPLHGRYVEVPDFSSQLKVVIGEQTEFYVFNGFAGRMDYQPHPH